jgi:hypothetical protein
MMTTTTRRRLSAVAAACLLSVALPTTAAWAQKTKTKGGEPPAAETTAPAAADTAMSEVSVDIPTIDAVGSNVDEATLRDIIGGNLVDNADALAGLTADSISIPTITVTMDAVVDGETTSTTMEVADVVLTDVVDGVAASITLGGMTMNSTDDATGEFGPMSASNFSIAGTLGMYGLVDGTAQTGLQTIYTDFSFEGGSITATDVTCTFGGVTVAEFKARPLNFSFADFITVAEQLEDNENDPQALGTFFRMYADLLTAFESSPATFEGFDCSGVDEEDQMIDFSVASLSMDGWTPGIYPSITMEGLDITVEGDGTVSIGTATMKQMDLTGPVATLQSAPDDVDETWFATNARALIPAFEGFAISDVSVDVPDPENPDARVVASVGSFDLTLGEYRNGIPTDLLTTATNVVIDLPTDSGDAQVEQLLALGVETIDLGLTIDLSWNEADSTIAIDEISMTGADLASVVLSGTLANVTEALFSLDMNEQMAASMGVAVKALTLDVNDEGLSDIILTQVAAEQGGTAEQMRPVFAGLAEGTVIGMLAGAAEASKVGAAVSSFIAGQAKHLTIEVTAKSDAGLGMMDFMAAETDPTSLIGKVNIDATAK